LKLGTGSQHGRAPAPIMLKNIFHAVAPAMKTAGRALDSLGASMEVVRTVENLVPSSTSLSVGDKAPVVDHDVFVAPTASVMGDVEIGAGSSVWYGAKVRGDVHMIRVGKNVTIGENSMVHVAKIQGDHPTIIGDGVTVGPNAVVHACTIKDNTLIGAGAQVLDGATVESNAIVAPGAMVTPNKVVPSGQLWAGSPAAFLRDLTDEEIASIATTAHEMSYLAQAHAIECAKTHEQITKDEEDAYDLQTRNENYFPREMDDEAHKSDVLGMGVPGMIFNSKLTAKAQGDTPK